MKDEQLKAILNTWAHPEDRQVLLKQLSELYDRAYAEGRKDVLKEAIEAVPEEQSLPKTKCINAENHLFGSCFQCEKTKGFNSCRQAVITNLLQLK